MQRLPQNAITKWLPVDVANLTWLVRELVARMLRDAGHKYTIVFSNDRRMACLSRYVIHTGIKDKRKKLQ